MSGVMPRPASSRCCSGYRTRWVFVLWCEKAWTTAAFQFRQHEGQGRKPLRANCFKLKILTKGDV
jgi:hypothetical protein